MGFFPTSQISVSRLQIFRAEDSFKAAQINDLCLNWSFNGGDLIILVRDYICNFVDTPVLGSKLRRNANFARMKVRDDHTVTNLVERFPLKNPLFSAIKSGMVPTCAMPAKEGYSVYTER